VQSSTTSSTGPFVGRAAELAVLMDALDRARSGSAEVVVVHGEPGIGKTRTVREFVRAARDGGATTLWGSCYEGGAARAYGPWVEAIGGHAEAAPEELRRAVGADAAVLAQLAPAVSLAVPDLKPAAVLPSDEGRLRLFEAVVRYLSCARSPVLVVLDDLQWADPAALDLFSYAARFGSGLLLVATYRGSELRLDDEVAQRVAQISRHRRCDYLLLDNLAQADALALLQGVAGRPLEDRVLEAIYTEAGGNPFFLGELGRHLSAHGRPEGDWRVPETIRGAIGLRLSAVSAQTRQTLELAAVFTAGFRFGEMLALTSYAEEDLLDAIDEALDAELIKPVSGERYDFAHALVRHALYERFSPSRRARLHRQVAEVLERAHADAPGEVAAEVARQYRLSATVPGAERGVAHALAAAEQARAAHAPVEAVAFLTIARDLARPDDVATRAAILRRLALAQAEAAMLDAAPRTLHAALDASGQSPEATATVVYQVVSALQDALADQDTLEPLIARGLKALGHARSLPWARLKLLERPLQPLDAGPVHAARWLGFDRDAVRIARAEGSEGDYARTIDAYEALPLSELDELARRVRSWSDPTARLRGLDVVVRCLTLVHGVTPSADALCTEFEQLAKAVGSLPARALACVYRAAILGVAGELEPAREMTAQALAFTERFDPAGRVNALAVYTDEQTAEHVAPDWDRTAERALQLALSRERIGWFGLVWGALASHAFARAGRSREARRLLEHIVPGLAAAAPTDSAQNRAVSVAGAAVWELGAPDLAQGLLPAAEALLEAGAGDWYMTSNELNVARLTTVLGRKDVALAHFARAREQCDRRGHRPLRAIVDFDEARARDRFREPGAAQLLSLARAGFEDIGMTAWSLRAAAQTAHEALPDGLTPREAEILRRVAAGRTNKEIAAELVVSVHTIERHLQNTYRKISVRNRADATAYVLGAGL
jgi:DNA-binding CsgD family transcriptional regulator